MKFNIKKKNIKFKSKISNLHYTCLNILYGCASLRGPYLLRSAMGTQFNVATVAGPRQLVLDLIDAGIEPGLPH